MAKLASETQVKDPIDSIRRLISETEGDTVQSIYNTQLRNILMGGMEDEMGFKYPKEPVLLISKSQLHGIITRVRTDLLQWTLKLEENGILGEGMRFSEVEVGKATRDEEKLAPVYLTIIGTANDSQIQMFSPGAEQRQ